MRVDWISREGELPCKKQKILWGPPVVWCILLRKWFRRVKASASIDGGCCCCNSAGPPKGSVTRVTPLGDKDKQMFLGALWDVSVKGLGDHRLCILFLFSWLWGSVFDPTAQWGSDLLPHHGGKHQERAFSGLNISELWMIIQTLHACYLEHFVIAMRIWLTANKYKNKFDPAEKQGSS